MTDKCKRRVFTKTIKGDKLQKTPVSKASGPFRYARENIAAELTGVGRRERVSHMVCGRQGTGRRTGP